MGFELVVFEHSKDVAEFTTCRPTIFRNFGSLDYMIVNDNSKLSKSSSWASSWWS